MKYLSLIALTVLLMFSCKDDDPTNGSVEVNIVHQIGNETLEANEMIYDSPANHKFSVSTIKYYISDVILEKDGDDFQLAKYQYIDFEDTNTLRFNVNNVAPGSYDKLRVRFGILRDDNVDGLLENTIENQNMLWPAPLKSADITPSGDYHYMKYEGRYDSLETGVVKTYKIHLGPTYGNDNSFEVKLPISTIDIDGNGWSIDLNVDMLEWLQNPSVYNYYQFGEGIMPKQDAQEYVKANGQSGVFSIGSVTKK